MTAYDIPHTAAHAPIQVGSRIELFVDGYLIDSMRNCRLDLQRPTRREVAFVFDAPWEGDSSAYVTYFRDGDHYRMYYRGSHWKPEYHECACVAESEDGIRWTRPKLGLFEYKGSEDNNIVWSGPGGHAFTPFKDTNPKAKPEELYKAVGPQTGSGKSGLLGFVSKDGYRWKQLQEKPIITEGNFDSQNLAFWDPNRKEYVCYFRMFRGGFPKGCRDIKRSTSRDFVHWTKPEWLEYTGAPTEQLYTNAITPYARAPHIYMGFPKRYVPNHRAHGGDGFSDGVFMTSRDGINFHRWREAFMRPGTDPENWLDRNNMASWGILQLDPNELSLYYLENNYKPSHHIMRATVRTDGFVSVHAGAGRGTMITKPLAFKGKELVINYSSSAAGSVRVEIRGEDGRPIHGFRLIDCPAIYGDEIEHVVRWKSGGNVSALAGKPVRLRFELQDADLYSIRFR